MMARQRTGLSRRLALVAACMLVLQSVVHAFAGQAPDILPFDAFGNPFCVTGASHSDTGHRGGDHDKLPECCILGCGMSSALPAAPSGGTSLIGTPRSSGAVLPPYCEVFIRRSDHEPGSARAPPPIPDRVVRVIARQYHTAT
ncbi:hypothetical protein CDO28_22650 (plasmid) [Sinorhizobium meliloti]|nr:hypothetical protein CDO28_22650 [Sinorhizobium meliloti]MDW9527577.1 hypothetical protein [Sinorhizobium meliloti]MDW9881432.1 hypothetical protein [Sinorhizobium meliloti]MDX0371994.1 hypothetical protein [Sinorhizobium meliloti]MQW11576.1 hypothetical protein [Sinorhizobium meliloti]